MGISHPNVRLEEIMDRKRQINFFSWGFQFEVLTAADDIAFDSAYQRRTPTFLRGLVVPVISREDLMGMKRRAGRPLDLEDLAFLVANS
jgi:hypothetical protein